MGLAIAGQIPSGIAIDGQLVSGMAIDGENVFSSGPSAPQWELLASGITGNPSVGITLDTTGANLLVVVAMLYQIDLSAGDITDNQSNTWTLGVTSGGTVSSHTSIAYNINPSTNATHTFTFTNSQYSVYAVLAYKCSQAVILDMNNSFTSGFYVPSLQLPAITPSKANSLIVTGTTINSGYVTAIDSDFIIVQQYTGGTRVGGGVSALLQSSPSSVAPTWTFNQGYVASAAMLNFIPSPWQLLASAQATYPTTSITLDTTGANLIVLYNFSYNYGLSGIPTDSLGNIYTQVINQGIGGGPVFTFNYCINPITGTNHTITYAPYSAGGNYNGFVILAFKCQGNVIFDQSVYAQASVTPAITPPFGPNALIVAAAAVSSSITGVPTGFTSAEAIPLSLVSGSIAYMLQGAPASVSPAWTFGNPSATTITGQMSFVSMPWKFLKSVVSLGQPASNPIDTTGANLLVANVAYLQGGDLNLTDSFGNTWLLGSTVDQPGTSMTGSLYYCINPKVGTNHVFNMNASGIAPAFYAVAFKCFKSIMFDQATSIATGGASVTAPAITPSKDNNLFIVGSGHNYTAVSVSAPFTWVGGNGLVGGQYFGAAMAYLIQGTAASVAPTVTVVPAANPYNLANMINFVPA